MGVSSDANLQMQTRILILSLNDDAMPALDCYPGSREEVSQRLVSALPALGQIAGRATQDIMLCVDKWVWNYTHLPSRRRCRANS
jgi:hypothetical protein